MATLLQIRAAAELERRRRNVGKDGNPFAQYRFEPIRYIIEKLGWHPWAGDADHPGQVEVLQAYELALRQLHERFDYEQGTLTVEQLRYWQPGQVIKNEIRIEAGHTIGKTKIASGIFSHFFDVHDPAIIYSFAPSYEQINDLLWKEIRSDRRKANLPGRVLETPELKLGEKRFAKGRATNDAHGRGTERTQGQHERHQMFIIDEAEGVADFVYSAIDSMSSGGIAIVLMLANPRTRTSLFYKRRTRATVANFRISCLYHPNVLGDKEIVPGAVRRDYVEKMIDGHCEIADKHDADSHTFELPWRPGTIYKPDAEYMFRVLGVAPKSLTERSMISTGHYESAINRAHEIIDEKVLRVGIDVARFGTDAGTIYCRHRGAIWRHVQMQGQDTNAYRDALMWLCDDLLSKYPIKRLHVRVDGGGGFASGIIDPLKRDIDFKAKFERVDLVEVNFGGTPYNPTKYADIATEMYAEAAETLFDHSIINPPPLLEEDLTDRLFEHVNKGGRTVRKLEDKDAFRKRHHRSPDDGDGFVLAAAPDHIFRVIDAESLVDFA